MIGTGAGPVVIGIANRAMETVHGMNGAGLGLDLLMRNLRAKLERNPAIVRVGDDEEGEGETVTVANHNRGLANDVILGN